MKQSREDGVNYYYEACNRQGKKFQGIVMADSRQEAARKIKRQGLWITAPLRCEQQAKNSWLHGMLSRSGRADDAQAALFCRQLAVLLSGGIPVHEALQALLAGGRQDSYTRLLTSLYKQIMQGKSLSAAMEESRSFSPQVVRLVAAGEQTGTLEETFGRLADFLSQLVKSQEQLKSVLLYPAILGVTALAALLFMVLFILPSFAAMLNSLQTELPWPTRMLLDLADFLQVYGREVMLGAGGLALGIYALSCKPWAVRFYHRLLLSLPLLGSLVCHSAWSLALGTLSMVLSQGLVLHEGIKMAAPVTGNRHIAEELAKVQARVERGSSFMVAMSACQAFPPILYEMLAAGEQAGQLDAMLARAAAFCQVQAENESARLQALAEPVAIFLVGGVVFFLVMAVIMPLLSTMDVLTM